MSQQTSRKTGLKSSAQKVANTRYGTLPMPATQKEAGAYGKEVPPQESARKPKASRPTKADQSNADEDLM